MQTDIFAFFERLKELAEEANRLTNGSDEKSSFVIKSNSENVEIDKVLNTISTFIEIQKRRQSAQNAITKILANSENLTEAMPEILKSICSNIGWQWAAMWTIDTEAEVLRCGGIWQAQMTHMDEFTKLNREFTFEKGIGLPGRVWQNTKPAWIIDVQSDPNFPRAPIARKVGLHAAFCFPIRSSFGSIGVMEFLTMNFEKPDQSLLTVMDDIGSQIGQFVMKKLAQELTEKKLMELQTMHKKLEHDFNLKMKDSIRLNAHHIVTKVLENASDLIEATPLLLKAICEGLGWEYSVMWKTDESENALQWLDCWHVSGVEFTEFDVMNHNMKLAKGVGLPGRVLAAGEPLWILDVVKDNNFVRAAAAKKVNLHGAFAFPVRSKNQVFGVMEFLSNTIEGPDEALLTMMDAVGSQIGQFIEKKQAENFAKMFKEEVELHKIVIEDQINMVAEQQKENLKNSINIECTLLGITCRENEIIKYLIQGFGSKQIAEQLCLSKHTINAHRRNILEKTKCKNTTELVSFVLKKNSSLI